MAEKGCRNVAVWLLGGCYEAGIMTCPCIPPCAPDRSVRNAKGRAIQFTVMYL